MSEGERMKIEKARAKRRIMNKGRNIIYWFDS